jgi:hypothetical protein
MISIIRPPFRISNAGTSRIKSWIVNNRLRYKFCFIFLLYMSYFLFSLILIPPHVCDNALLENILVAYADIVTACSLLPIKLAASFSYLWTSRAVSSLCLLIKHIIKWEVSYGYFLRTDFCPARS